jgi:hypothetical protein
MTELLRLRGEMGSLKSQLAKATGATVGPAVTSSQTNESRAPVDEQRRIAVHRMISAKKLVAAIWYGYAEHHQNQFPTNWDQVESYFAQEERNDLNPGEIMPDTAADFSEVTNEFDIVYQQPITNLYGSTNFGDLIVVRTRQPLSTSDGRRIKVYGFADGHSQIQAEPPEGFDIWESQHMAFPSGNQ